VNLRFGVLAQTIPERSIVAGRCPTIALDDSEDEDSSATRSASTSLGSEEVTVAAQGRSSAQSANLRLRRVVNQSLGGTQLVVPKCDVCPHRARS
jgi:hypothetical protein